MQQGLNFLGTVTLLVGAFLFSNQARSEAAFTYSEMSNHSIEEFTDVINEVFLMDDYPINGLEVDENCKKFMDSKLVLGPLGKYIKSELVTNKDNYKYLLNQSTIKNYCPKYTEMNLNDRAFLWTLVMSAMAHFESSCNIKASIKGPNGYTYGYYQLHKGKEGSYDGESSTCFKNISTDPEGSSRCALAMLDLQIKNRDGQLFTSKSYWDVLRPAGPASKISKAPQRIKKAIINHKACQ